ncbi:MAG: hypothetical protein U5N86_13680 [Planctomycetota bacterium]|nr:hypothetical protein [Planctomycetota bacterium]
MDFGAFAFDLGAESTFRDVEAVPYIGLEIVYYAGADDDTYGYVTFNDNFVKTLVVGVFMNTFYASSSADAPEYWTVMLQGGMKSIADDKFGLDFIFAYYQSTEDIDDKGIGWEFNAVGSYRYTEDVTFGLGIGYFSPDEDMAGEDPDAAMVAFLSVVILF